MANGERSPSKRILETAKTLVTAYGQSECARQLALPLGTVCSWAKRYGWKRVTVTVQRQRPLSVGGGLSAEASPSKTQQERNTPSEAIEHSLRTHRNRSVIALAQWTAEASEEALQSDRKLPEAKRVKDVAQVHSILWPNESQSEIISFDILTGAKPVLDESGENGNMPSTPSPLALPTPSDHEHSTLD